jgi:serine/threonine protein kinase/tetratricopeptide (TPR) repeat protein
MGVVYKAEDLKLRRIVALKFLPPHLTASPEEEARFLQEAQAAATLNHPNVCTIYDIKEHELPASAGGKGGKQQFIVMEFVEGMTLRKKIAQSPFTPDEAILIASQIGDALAEAHAKGIVHRDIKSENIMVNLKNQAKVMDFGLAKLKGSLKLTKTSSTIGTLGYMAPEQIQGGAVDARSDIFSFGVVLFEILTGQLPFRGEHDAAMMYSILNEEPEKAGRFRPDLTPELDRVIARALEKDPEDRYQSAADMVSELRRIKKQSSRVTRPLQVPHSGEGGRETSGTASAAPPPALPSPALPSRSGSRNMKLFAAAGVVLLAIAAVLGYRYFFGAASPIDSLAVLPFVNAGADSSMEYLTDGMTESIINSLTRIPQLRVIPRSTVFRFKGKDADPQEIGSKLNVRAVLSGRVSQRGDEITLQLDLIDVRSQAQIWGEQYRRKANEVISLQEDVVKDVSKELSVALTGETKVALAKHSTENPDAYKLYLQGRYFWQKRRGTEIRKAIDYLNQAIALDPGYALAYAGLADCYLLLEQYAGQPWKEVAPLGEHAARRALELDKSLGEAHASLAFIRMNDWDWSGAEKEFTTAIELSPKYATARHWYGILLGREGRMEESYHQIEAAYEIDPLAPVILLNMMLANDRVKDDYATAVSFFQKGLELDASFYPAYHSMGRVQTRRAMYPEAVQNLQKALELSSGSSEVLSSQGYCLGLMGKKAEALAIVHELEGRYARSAGAAYSIARVYAGLDDRDKAIEWLQRDLSDHSGWIAWILYDFEFDKMRQDPRFRDIVHKVGLDVR